MVPGLKATEIQARGKGDVFRFKKMPTKIKGITAKSTDVGLQVKRAFRLHRNTEAQLTQGG